MRAARFYVPMVGIPLIGVLLVLRAGEGLSAPRAIHGTWRVRSMSVPAGAGHCLAGITSDSMHTLVVSQSGPDATVAVRSADASSWGSAAIGIAGDAATGALAGGAAAGCAGGATLTLRLPARAVADTLFGSLADPTCAGCAPLTFVATRRVPPK